MKTTLCRWCGGEMEIIERDDHHFPSLPHMYLWRCTGCRMESNTFITETAALAWATQPIPFMFEYKDGDVRWLDLRRAINKEITSALEVKTKEDEK